jgi:16S rRNA (uracil1498-N3)-methyltransferase
MALLNLKNIDIREHTMFVPRIYIPVAITVGENFIATKTISHYLQDVLRCKQDDPVILFNGEGGEYSAKIHLSKKHFSIEILSFDPVERESPCKIHLGQSLIRGDRMDFVIQKATELGVQSITPLIAHHSIVKIKEEKNEKKKQHWQNIAISASEQSGRTSVPIIHDPISIETWASEPFEGTSIVFDIHANETLKSLASDHAYRVAIGPESGWELNELAFFQNAHFIACQLGPRILRTETAGMTSVALLQALHGDL